MNSKKNTLLRLFGFLLLTVLFYHLFYSEPLSLFPTNETHFEFSALTNDSAGTAAFDSAHEHLHFRYTLEDEESSPILLFHAHELARTINLKNYDYLHIDTDPQDNRDFTVTFYMFIPHFSDPLDMQTHRPYTFICRADSSHSCFSLAIKDFATPTYWFSLMNIHEEELPPTDWTQMSHMAFGNFSGFGDDTYSVEQRLTFSDIHFGKNPIKPAATAGAIACTLVWIYSFLIHKRKRVKRSTIKSRIYGEKSELVKPHDTERLLQFIEQNYGDPFFTLEMIEKELSLNHYQVNFIIKQQYDIGYKQYLNQTRITEAKRLLRESDYSVSVIGQRVGYIHSNSFARMFRNSEGIAPNSYRRKFQELKN